ncbi:MAG: hypothetical protein BMS9Abin28_1288 [Anaerolineae bacterium]|nr:MAG: hypothetical protein BMS9Abin28_1288 [Anaerolineae bacterium]
MGSESEPGDAMEQQIGSESEGVSAGDAAEQQIGKEISDGERPEPDTPEAKAESRVGRFLKRVFRWAVLLLVIFTLGVMALEIVQVRPLRAERNRLDQSLAEAAATQQELQAEIDRLDGVEAENQVLAESIRQAEARLVLLNVLVDITRAQLALAQKDPVRVAAALKDTGEKLRSLRDLLGPTEIEGLRERLVLVLSEVDGDPFAAERDLEILANTLLEIEREQSGE